MPKTSTRRRLYHKPGIASFGSGSVIYREPQPGGKETVDSGSASLQGREITTSEGHFYTSSYKGVDHGGDFFTQKYWMEPLITSEGSTRHYGWSGGRYSTSDVSGQFLVNPHPQPSVTLFGKQPEGHFGFNWDTVPFGIRLGSNGATSPDQLDSVGATLVARCKPGESPANLAAALIELKNDGLPSLVGLETWKDRKKPPKGVSSDFLNYQFGILPLISDIKSVGGAIVNSDKHIRQLVRDNGKLVRRRLELDPIVSHATLIDEDKTHGINLRLVGCKTNVLANYLAGRTYRRTVSVTTTDRYWFSGAFTYYLGENMLHKNALIRNAARWRWLLGTDLSLDTIYQVAPWSWAVDWFSNLGDVVSNISSFQDDGLLMPYGYVMRHRHVKVEASFTPHGPGSSKIHGSPNFAFSTVYHLDQKERRKANPFGFGLKDEGLSLKQKAILTALGITRVL